jgi:Domain of unknown function (DUF3560)
MRPYAERRQARIDRLRARAERAQAEANSAFKRVDQISSVIPLGQPILVGHHSERRHRRDLDKIHNGMRKGIEASKEAAELDRRADAAEENDAISSDDPEAVTLLRAKLAKLEQTRDRFKEVNTTLRTAQRNAKKLGQPWEPYAVSGLIDMGLTAEAATKLITPDFAGRVGIAAYELTNLGGNIRRIEARIKQLESNAARQETPPETYGDIRVEESENRVRIYFPGKPDAAVRDRLKSRGFRWSPTEGAWQRMASNGAWYEAREIAKTVANHGIEAK